MSLIEKFEGLDHFQKYFIDHFELDPKIGFRFHEIHPGMTLHDAQKTLGNPTHLLDTLDSQQTAEYVIPICHPMGGAINQNDLTLLLWAFHREPIKIIKLRLNYARDGIYNEAYTKFIKSLIKELIEKFGKPTEKSLRKGREHILYEYPEFNFKVWYAYDGLRLQLVAEKSIPRRRRQL